MERNFFGAWFDESERGNILALGGFFAPITKVDSLVSGWRDMKVSLNLDPWAEVKWKLSEDHPTRKQLEAADHTTRELSEKALEIITNQATITGLVTVMIESRREDTKNMIKRVSKILPSVRDFYCEALGYLLQRLAEGAEEDYWTSCIIVCDNPGLGKKKFRMGKLWREPTAHYKKYKNCYENGPGVGPGKKLSEKGLYALRFYPSLVVADATFDDMLQIADIIVGCTADWVSHIAKDKEDTWLQERFIQLVGILRNKYGSPGFWGDGLVLWPRNELWYKVRRAVENIIQ